MADKEAERLSELLSYGQKANEAIYFELLRKINNKEKLTPTEQRTFHTLGRELQAVLQSMGNDDVRMGYQESCEYLQLSKRSVSHHVHKGHIKMHPDGGFLKSELDRYKSQSGYGMTEDGDDIASMKEKADLTLKQLRARREEFLVMQMSSQYISLPEAYSAWASRVKELATALMSWENALAPLLEMKTKHEARAILSREVRSILERFSRTGKWTPEVALPSQCQMPKSGQTQSEQ